MPTAASVLAELTRRGADAVPHGRSSLLHHLRGTHAILERWAQPEAVRLAGLMHSIYATDVFEPALVGLDERASIGALIGAEAERLVFLFCSIDRRDLFSTIAAAPDDVRAPLRLTARADGTPLNLSAAEAGDLLALYLANAAEQTCRQDGSPAAWLAHVSQLAAWSRDRARVVPPVFAHGTAMVTHDEQAALLAAYATAFEPANASRRASLQPLHRRTAVGEPLIVAALHELVAGDSASAAELAGHGRALLVAWNTAWDKRLSVERWLQLAALPTDLLIASAQRRDLVAARLESVLTNAKTPADLHARLEESGLLSAVEPLPPRFANYLAQLRDDSRPPSLQRYPGLSARPWHDPAAFAIVADLERMAPSIARECRSLHDDAFHTESENIARVGNWDVSLLYERGRRIEETCARCPATIAAIERHRIVRGPAGLAYFSRLAPHTRIAPHAGPTNLRLRCHLAIDVPDDCGLTVGAVTRTWTPGRCIVFDDSFVHEAWNDSDRERIVFIVDIWHPDLTDDEVRLLEGLHGHVAGHAANLRSYWARNDEARRDYGGAGTPNALSSTRFAR